MSTEFASEKDRAEKRTIISPDNEIKILLQEYQASAAGITENVKRIDLIRGLYATALVAVAAFILKPEGAPLQDRLGGVTKNQLILSLLLSIPILNATLLIHVTSFMHFILAAAKYNTHYLGGRLSTLTGRPALSFDLWESPAGDKGAWLFTGTVVGMANFALLTLLSISILVEFRAAGLFRLGWIPGILYCAGILMIGFSFAAALVFHLTSRRFGETTALIGAPARKSPWYALSIPLSFGLYIVIVYP